MRILTALLPLAAFMATPVFAGQADRAGHYYLRGVMETGSDLMLHADGRFQWYLVYGALDLFAEGDWREADGAVILTARKSKDVPQPGFETLVLTVKDRALIPPDARGAYTRPSDESD